MWVRIPCVLFFFVFLLKNNLSNLVGGNITSVALIVTLVFRW